MPEDRVRHILSHRIIASDIDVQSLLYWSGSSANGFSSIMAKDPRFFYYYPSRRLVVCSGAMEQGNDALWENVQDRDRLCSI
ncbi:hypothetical protein AVEN_253668-1 [Araneus ventricosus]|uniref:Uncharacterized protein n=1 Tax=Araneus ventricosus TaxID=182803 RepID=A0A4Y2RSZ6_ARAVE|nr:hypothetical protein AVEN_253668-1 [Araneus ventricosus]